MGTGIHKVVIVGGGVGGIRVAKKLASKSGFDVTLISDTDSFSFQNSSLLQPAAATTLHSIFSSRRNNLDLVRATVDDFDPANNTIITTTGIPHVYDSVLFALGRETHYLQDNRMPKYVYSAYSMGDMRRLARRLTIDAETGTLPKDVLVVGSGPTGLQAAGELQSLLANYQKSASGGASSRVTLIEQENRILPSIETRASLQKAVRSRLSDEGIDVMLGAPAQISEKGVCSAGSAVFDDAVICLANGQIVNNFFIRNKDNFTLNRKTLVRVNDLLEADGYSNVYAVGDCAATEYSGYSSSALYDADFVADILVAKSQGQTLKAYDPPKPELIIPIGRNWALAVLSEQLGVRHGIRAMKRKSWIDRKQFSTLVGKRRALRY